MKLLKAIYSLFESIGQARTASHLARQGNIKAAKEAMGYTSNN